MPMPAGTSTGIPIGLVDTGCRPALLDNPSRRRAVRASRDRAGLRESIWRHLTASGAAPSHPGGRRRRQRVPYAFDLWIAHLLLLEQALEVAPIPWSELRAEELDGLLLLRAAQERFRREYHPCGQCGAPVKGKICPRCGTISGTVN